MNNSAFIKNGILKSYISKFARRFVGVVAGNKYLLPTTYSVDKLLEL
jgi:hypothetical protein